MLSVLAAEIPDGLIYGIVPIVLSLLFGWAAWMTLLGTRTDARSEADHRELADHETRIRSLETNR